MARPSVCRENATASHAQETPASFDAISLIEVLEMRIKVRMPALKTSLRRNMSVFRFGTSFFYHIPSALSNANV
jgi:hypothetical protein